MKPVLNLIEPSVALCPGENGVRLLYNDIPVPMVLKDDGAIKAAYRININILIIWFASESGHSSYYFFRMNGKTISCLNFGYPVTYKSVYMADGHRIFASRPGGQDIIQSKHAAIEYNIESVSPEIPVKKVQSSYLASRLAVLDKGLPFNNTHTLRNRLHEYIYLIKQGICTKDHPPFRKILRLAMDKIYSYCIPIDQINHPEIAKSRQRFEEALIDIKEKPCDNPDYVAIKAIAEKRADNNKEEKGKTKTTPSSRISVSRGRLTYDNSKTIYLHLSKLIDKIKNGNFSKDNPQFKDVLAAAFANIPSYRIPIDQINHPKIARARLRLEEALINIKEKPDENPDYIAIKAMIKKLTADKIESEQATYSEQKIKKVYNSPEPVLKTFVPKGPLKSDNPEVIRARLDRFIKHVKKGCFRTDDPLFIETLDAARDKVFAYFTPIDQITRLDTAEIRMDFEISMVEIGLNPDNNDDLAAIVKKVKELKEIPGQSPNSGGSKNKPKFMSDLRTAQQYRISTEKRLEKDPRNEKIFEKLCYIRKIEAGLKTQKLLTK